MKTLINNMKLMNKFMFISLLIVTLTIVANLLNFYVLKNAYDKELYDKSLQLLSLFAEDVQTELEQIVYDSESIITDDMLQRELSAIKNCTEGTEEWLEAFHGVKERIGGLGFYSEDIKYIYLRSEDGKSFGKFSDDQKLLAKYEEQLINSAQGINGRERWVYIPEMTGELVLVREIREKKDLTLNNLGTLMLKINLEDIINRCNALLLKKDVSIKVAIYQNDDMIYASENAVGEIELCDESYNISDTSIGKMFCVYYTFNESGWTYVTAIPYTDIFRSVNLAVRTSLLVVFGITIIAIVLSVMLTKSVVKHIDNLIAQCDFFAKGEYIPASGMCENYRTRQDEIGKLYRHFDRMATENKKMIQETYIKQQLLLEAQVSNLKAQISPHFIYNTLESIYCLAQSRGDERIATMTSSLGKLLRSSLKEQRNIITLKEDLKVAEEYLKIQAIRLGKRLHITNDVDPKYEKVKIPSMTIQPLVENAIFYAAEEMQETCEIYLYCREENGFIEFVVEDNGPGMDEDILEKLENGHIIPKGLGIGLENINKRLGILISKESGIRIERKNERTYVIVRLTKQYEDEG